MTGAGIEIIVEGNTATYMMYNGLETVCTTGTFALTEDGTLRWVTSDYYLAYGNTLVHRQEEQAQFAGTYATIDTPAKLYEDFEKVEKADLYERCYGIVEKYNSSLNADEKTTIRDKIMDALQNQANAGKSIQVALAYDGQLLVGSIGGMSYSKRIQAQEGMQKAELAAVLSCILIKSDIEDVRKIFESKMGTESLVRTLTTLEALYDNICNMTTNSDHDQLMDMCDAIIAAGDALSEISEIILEEYLE